MRKPAIAILDNRKYEIGGQRRSLSFEDVKTLVGTYSHESRETVQKTIEAFHGACLVNNYGKERYLHLLEEDDGIERTSVNELIQSAPKYIIEGSDDFDREQVACYSNARELLLVFLKCLLLTKETKRELTYQDISQIGVIPTTIQGKKDALVRLDYSKCIESSNYLEYLSKGCEESSNELECTIKTFNHNRKTDNYWGWSIEKIGLLEINCGEYPVSCSNDCSKPEEELKDEQIRRCVNTLLSSLMTLHLQDTRPYVAFDRKLKLSGGCLLSGIWVLLQEQLKTGEVGICPSCENIIYIHSGQGSARVWCEMNGTCAKKGQRARNYARYCKEGLSSEIAGQKAHIKPSTARRILNNLNAIKENEDHGSN